MVRLFVCFADLFFDEGPAFPQRPSNTRTWYEIRPIYRFFLISAIYFLISALLLTAALWLSVKDYVLGFRGLEIFFSGFSGSQNGSLG